MAALDGLAAIGQCGDHLDQEALIRHVSGPGSSAQWISKFVPMGTPEQNTATSATVPWAHVSEEIRQSLRDGYARALAATSARDAPERPVPSPSGPCLMCGVERVLVSAIRMVYLGGIEAATDSAWRAVVASPRALGGHGGAQLKGHLCPDCSEAMTQVGSIGHAACERALSRYLIWAGRTDEARLVQQEGLSRVPAWAARPDRKANTEPWAHIKKIVPAAQPEKG